ncbi:group III truncated hemoglobin [Flaviaesturariibacter amylovorans]|uniref:Group III truncated hemoglobin n=1 Tax=Flaviaesturariibacter amylovorans TaxID=1084520 RepID=A0ABP8GDC9_9BACT
MMRDLETRADIEAVLTEFYAAAFADDRIGRFFTEVVPLDLAAHLPHIADFWESVVLGGPHYAKNVMAVHQQIHNLSPIQKEHLDRWVELFTATVAVHFEGPKATLMQQRARSVATLMDIKLNHPPKSL